jgi:hypothetical protein
MESHDGSHQLASIAANGKLRFFPTVSDPYNFVSVSSDNELHAGMFCCIYTSSVPATQYQWHEQFADRLFVRAIVRGHQWWCASKCAVVQTKAENEFTYYFVYLIYLVLNKCVQ